MSESDTGSETVEAWLAALAATGPNPGGGAAAALMAGMAAALAEMVIAYRASGAPTDSGIRTRADQALAAAMRRTAPLMADQDTAASAGFAAASREESGPEAREAAGVAAAESSVALGRFARSLVPVLRELAESAGTLLLADVGIAACALAASARAAVFNACADLQWAGLSSKHHRLREELEALDAVAQELDAIAGTVRARLLGSA